MKFTFNIIHLSEDMNSLAILHHSESESRKSTWVHPYTAALEISVEPNCRVCQCAMDSWDMYFDHLMFDQDHRVNEMRMLAERGTRTKPPTLSSSPRNRYDFALTRRQPSSPTPSPMSSPSSPLHLPFHSY